MRHICQEILAVVDMLPSVAWAALVGEAGVEQGGRVPVACELIVKSIYNT